MHTAIERAIHRIHNRLEDAELSEILQRFYREYTAENLLLMLQKEEEQEIKDLKIGGTD